MRVLPVIDCVVSRRIRSTRDAIGGGKMRKSIFFLVVMLGLFGCKPGGTRLSPAEGFIDVPGGRVWYRVVGKGPRTPLVLLHGGPGAPSYYLKPLAALGDERPVVFYDQLGCGRSDRPKDSALWTIPRFVAELP